MKDSIVKNKLKSLCCCNGWSYGVFWHYHETNSMLLTCGDAYYEDQFGAVVESMLVQVHILGEGIIGQVALAGSQQWMFFDAQSRNWKSPSGTEDVLKDSIFDCQTYCGIKTIAIISVKPWGVLQFGSTQKIAEMQEFLNQTQLLFRNVANANVLTPLPNAPLLFKHEADDNSGLLGSIVRSGNYLNTNQSQGCPLTCSISDIQHERTDSILEESLNCKSEQQIIARPQQLSLRPAIPPSLAANAHLLSGMTLPDVDLSSTGVVSPACCRSMAPPNFQSDSTFNPLDSLGDFVDMGNFELDSFNNLTTSSFLTSSSQESEIIFPDLPNSQLAFPEEGKPANFIENLSKFFRLDDLSQWFTHSTSYCTGGTETMMKNMHPNLMGVSSISSSLVEDDLFTSTPITHTANSGQSSVTNILDPSVHEEFFNVKVTGTNMCADMGMNHGNSKATDSCENQVIPVRSIRGSAITAAESDCVSEVIASAITPRGGLFSELGLHELLDGIVNSGSVTSSFVDGPSAMKRRKVESPLVTGSQVEIGSLPSSVGSLTYVHDQESNLLPKNDIFRKSQVGLWIDDSYSINIENVVGAKPKWPKEPTKISGKRARPGESTRPRPKDRQQIQDRLKELRGIVPNGQKSSIDSLLDGTIKYMLFLQNVTKYADKLIQADEPKLINQENGVILKDSNKDSGSRGATWAYEVGNQTTACPIIVEDVSSSGQMRIEMLSEDRGLFLEIADVIRGIGLNILKGVMEVQGTKIWARFTVEANRHVTRMDIFLSLVQFLEDTSTSVIDTTDQPKIEPDDPFPSLCSYQQCHLSLPIS